MKKITLSNKNIVVINSLRYASNKCIFTYSIYQINGNWKYTFCDNFNMDYYESVEDYILSNY
jgi:hypothetical protein